jgi:hypothetical protein
LPAPRIAREESCAAAAVNPPQIRANAAIDSAALAERVARWKKAKGAHHARRRALSTRLLPPKRPSLEHSYLFARPISHFGWRGALHVRGQFLLCERKCWNTAETRASPGANSTKNSLRC